MEGGGVKGKKEVRKEGGRKIGREERNKETTRKKQRKSGRASHLLPQAQKDHIDSAL